MHIQVLISNSMHLKLSQKNKKKHYFIFLRGSIPKFGRYVEILDIVSTFFSTEQEYKEFITSNVFWNLYALEYINIRDIKLLQDDK